MGQLEKNLAEKMGTYLQLFKWGFNFHYVKDGKEIITCMSRAHAFLHILRLVHLCNGEKKI